MSEFSRLLTSLICLSFLAGAMAIMGIVDISQGLMFSGVAEMCFSILLAVFSFLRRIELIDLIKNKDA